MLSIIGVAAIALLVYALFHVRTEREHAKNVAAWQCWKIRLKNNHCDCTTCMPHRSALVQEGIRTGFNPYVLPGTITVRSRMRQ